VRWAGRSAGAAGSFARHSHEGIDACRSGSAVGETIASACEGAPEDGGASPGVQQPHSDGGRSAQQARGAGATTSLVQAEATSATDTVPTIAKRATQRGRMRGRDMNIGTP
jgi:hypothetical protein